MKIHITGSTGSGKTTYSKQIAKELNIPRYELDDIHWIRDPKSDTRRPIDEKLALLKEIVIQNDWVIEGVQFKWSDASFEAADVIIVLDVSKIKNRYQIVKRFFKQKLGLENSKYKPSLKALKNMFGWEKDYRTYEKEQLFIKLEPYKEKVYFIKSQKDREDVMKKLINEKKKSS
ncbi:DNA topology modulation protein FlaR [Bacillus clarus]|uniref:DNA topology modulation protein FlaR n=1 Tax=Bacillus clarus TaxID=2338372 RepID=A0A090ZBR7_9BACI|nr:isopentenyl transferase family protein [Bacillus clarus]KFN01751.1 isopentenyl transferase family protein [Bacillus clarus]RFT67561.1 DNA topology modulation protein FlaR [Bacillus clarus]